MQNSVTASWYSAVSTNQYAPHSITSFTITTPARTMNLLILLSSMAAPWYPSINFNCDVLHNSGNLQPSPFILYTSLLLRILSFFFVIGHVDLLLIILQDSIAILPSSMAANWHPRITHSADTMYQRGLSFPTSSIASSSYATMWTDYLQLLQSRR